MTTITSAPNSQRQLAAARTTVWAEVLLIILVAVVCLAAGLMLFQPGHLYGHDDSHTLRILEMEHCFRDGQIPCRWSPDLAYGYGQPMFNFYPPLPYMVSMGFRWLGASLIDTAKYSFVVALVASGLGMYFLVRSLYGRLGAIISAVFYVWAPYRALQTFVRGSLNETWGMIFFPFILWTAYRLITAEKRRLRWVVGLALSWFGLFTSHNLMVLSFIGPFAAWCLFWFLRSRNWRNFPPFTLAGIWGLGMAAFFTIPALIENRLIHIDTVLYGYFDHTSHFATWYQLLISRYWGYGSSWRGTEMDEMSFQVGILHWVLSLLFLAWLLYWIKRRRKLDDKAAATLLMVAVGWLAVFLIHKSSNFIWVTITPLQYLQFPWRLLSISTLCFSITAGALDYLLPGDWSQRLPVVILVASLVPFSNWQYFQPENGLLEYQTDADRFSGRILEHQISSAIYDYLPLTASLAPSSARETVVDITAGEGHVYAETMLTNRATASVEVFSEQATIRFNIVDYPVWQVSIDGQPVAHYRPDDEQHGRLYVDLPQGLHEISATFTDPPVRTVSNIASLIAWLALVGVIGRAIWLEFKPVKS